MEMEQRPGTHNDEFIEVGEALEDVAGYPGESEDLSLIDEAGEEDQGSCDETGAEIVYAEETVAPLVDRWHQLAVEQGYAKVETPYLPGSFIIADFDHPFEDVTFPADEIPGPDGPQLVVETAGTALFSAIERGAAEGRRLLSEDPGYDDHAGQQEASSQAREAILQMRSQRRVNSGQPVTFSTAATALTVRGLESLAARGKMLSDKYADIEASGGKLPAPLKEAIREGRSAENEIHTV